MLSSRTWVVIPGRGRHPGQGCKPGRKDLTPGSWCPSRVRSRAGPLITFWSTVSSFQIVLFCKHLRPVCNPYSLIPGRGQMVCTPGSRMPSRVPSTHTPRVGVNRLHPDPAKLAFALQNLSPCPHNSPRCFHFLEFPMPFTLRKCWADVRHSRCMSCPCASRSSNRDTDMDTNDNELGSECRV